MPDLSVTPIAPAGAAEPLRVIMLPSVTGGLGHISRTATLARALRRLDPSVEVVYVLDCERLRPFNIDATLQMGYRPRLMPLRTRESRSPIVRACLGDADVIVDDTSRYLVPLRHLVPRAGWVSIPMTPINDELFLDWPFMAQMDAVIWAYAPALVPPPPEMEVVRDRTVVTGPFLDVAGVPDRAAARALAGFQDRQRAVAYAPRGFPFGREFGHRVLAGVYGAVEALRRSTHPDLELVLLSVREPSELRGVEGVPDTLPPWVRVHGILPQAEAMAAIRAMDILVAEGTSTMHEAAALGTPQVLVPGPIQETLTLARALGRKDAARVLEVEKVDPDALAALFSAILDNPSGTAAMAERARALVSGGGGGVDEAARLVLDLARERRGAAPSAGNATDRPA